MRDTTVSRLRQRFHIVCHPIKRRRVLANLALAMEQPYGGKLVGRHVNEQLASANLAKTMRHYGGAA
jgi:hypothetical protein